MTLDVLVAGLPVTGCPHALTQVNLGLLHLPALVRAVSGGEIATLHIYLRQLVVICQSDYYGRFIRAHPAAGITLVRRLISVTTPALDNFTFVGILPSLLGHRLHHSDVILPRSHVGLTRADC